MHDDTFNKKFKLIVGFLPRFVALGCTMRFNFNETCVILSAFVTRLRFDNIL